MDRNTRLFIVASLIYLAAGAVLGLMMGMSPRLPAQLLFSHVHLLLGGFMAMMIYGVGYFILPRFAATNVRWPAMVGVHFWLAQFSLLGMVVSRPMSVNMNSAGWTGVFHLSALLQLLSIFLFVANLGLTLVGKPRREEADSGAAAESVPATAGGSPSLAMAGAGGGSAEVLGADSAVGLWVDHKQGALDLLVQAGLTPLGDPQHLEMVRRAGIPLSHACSKHGIDLEPLLARLRALPDQGGPVSGTRLTPDHLIGQLVKAHPATREVLRSRFGEGCFTCPGFETETLAQGALMHGVKVDELIADLERVLNQD